MEIVALIACTKKKRKGTFEAKYLYDESPLFRKSYQYAKQFTNKIYILSAKYGLLKDTDVVSTYDETLKTKNKKEREIWGSLVKNQMSNEFDLKNTKFIILAGNSYIQPIEDVFELAPDLPLESLGFGKRLKWLNSKITK